MKPKPVAALIAMLLLFVAQGYSHDYWLEPASFYLPANGGKVNVRMHLGARLMSEEERPLQKARTPRFQLISSAGSEDLLITGMEGRTPVAQLTTKASGNYLIAMERAPTLITLEANKFEAYLAEEGLQPIIAERKRLNESAQIGHERYSRYLKTLLQIGELQDDTFARIVGHRLEIVPESNPYKLKAGDKLRVRVTFDGQPLRGVKVFAHHREAGKIDNQESMTNPDGRAEFSIARRGVWLIRLVHMRRCEAADCGEVDWESFWLSLTFGMK